MPDVSQIALDIAIPGVEITRTPTFVDHRRVLVVDYNLERPPGELGYSVVVQPDQVVGNHYHLRRHERILLLHGAARFRLHDCRDDSPTRDADADFSVGEPGLCVHVPPGVAHAIQAADGLVVLHVLASVDYDPDDDFRLELIG